jgi:hypothetical protein
MLLTCYLASAALVYFVLAKRAPIIEEPMLAFAVQPVQCEIIELFATPAAQSVSRAA